MHRRTCLVAIGAGNLSVAGCLERRIGANPVGSDEDDTAGSGDEGAEDVGTIEGETPASTVDTETATPIHEGYETATVRAMARDGDLRGTVTAAIADTADLRDLGLSDTETLPPDRGMLFVYESVADRTFVMRDMDFGIDIVFADADGAITTIHHAPKPGPGEDGNDHRYSGRGRYVLEVVYRWTLDHGVAEGDVLEFDAV